ncbi:hypothetical protein BT96DRAFT_63333 [Gymnopus androsaceus JB14]|uniref:Uncharacterized protein n=1 Tax=Gymnopus androsaceus JB14 TaxID=1447944 RepID=A0A6A4HKX5_9AGAR|nr:hypothetical protein BT96DRAFT_63333 [Gymnopus androsaceus JB14]
MLPYALKIVWFSLSLSGLISCWAVLSAFALAVPCSYWLAILYCVGCTILQGIFCLGLIWRMDPFLMPRSFCIAQTLLTGFSTFLLTGVCATFSMVTSLTMLRPGIWNLSTSKTLAWHPSYTLTLVIFPILASAAQITAVFKLDAVQPTDNFSCDASKPIWVRFLGYAGTPLIFSIPFSCFALMAVIRVFRNNTPDPDCNSTNLTSLPPKRIRMGTRRKDMGTWLGSEPGIRNSPIPIPTPRALPSPSPSVAYAYYPASPGRAPISPNSPVLSFLPVDSIFPSAPLAPLMRLVVEVNVNMIH